MLKASSSTFQSPLQRACAALAHLDSVESSCEPIKGEARAVIAPDVGTHFLYEDRVHRVTGWIEEAPQQVPPWLSRAMDAASTSGPPTVRRWTTRERATHVAGSGIRGCVAKVGEVVVVGRVNWTEEAIAAERDFAKSLAVQGRSLG